MLSLSWVKCRGDVWCGLRHVDLGPIDARGVYIIWHGGNPGRVVRVGKGDIASAVTAERTDPDVLAYLADGELYVTWASVPAHQIDGVHRYLSAEWRPLIEDPVLDVAPLPASAPFAA